MQKVRNKMRQFYLAHPICVMPSHKLQIQKSAELPLQLGWSHYVELFSYLMSDFKTLFSPYSNNKTTLVAINCIPPSSKPYYLITRSINLQKI